MHASQSTLQLVRKVGVKAGLPTLVVFLLLLLAPERALCAEKQVRLLIPILTGAELDLVRKLAPQAAIVRIDGATYLEVGAFTDARVAHRLGRSIQKRLSIPFDLAYDPDHPQIALALGEGPRKPGPPPQVIAQQAPVAQRLAMIKAPMPAPKPPTAKPRATDPFWSAISVSAPASTDPGMAPIATVAEAPAPTKASTTPEPEPDEPMRAVEVAPPAALQAAEEPVAALSAPNPRATAETQRSHPWLRPVQIAAVKVDVPVSRSGVAVNPHLNYLYVKIQKPDDVARLQQISPVLELNPVGDTLVARLGTYTRSRLGRRLMEAKLAELRQHKVDVMIAEAGSMAPLIG